MTAEADLEQFFSLPSVASSEWFNSMSDALSAVDPLRSKQLKFLGDSTLLYDTVFDSYCFKFVKCVLLTFVKSNDPYQSLPIHQLPIEKNK